MSHSVTESLETFKNITKNGNGFIIIATFTKNNYFLTKSFEILFL